MAETVNSFAIDVSLHPLLLCRRVVAKIILHVIFRLSALSYVCVCEKKRPESAGSEMNCVHTYMKSYLIRYHYMYGQDYFA